VTTRKLFSAIFLLAFLPTLGISANTHGDDQAARERVRIAVRSELHLKLDQFLRVQEDEALERRLAEIVARPSWSASIYKVSEEGDEIKDHVIVHHIVMDGDPTFTVAMNPASENVYRIQGFSDSLAEFNKLMRDADLKVAGSDQAEAVAGFYQQVNPQRSSVVQMSSLLELQQAAERQCQAIPFDPRERNFEAWWKHTPRLPMQRPPSSKRQLAVAAAMRSNGWCCLLPAMAYAAALPCVRDWKLARMAVSARSASARSNDEVLVRCIRLLREPKGFKKPR
jgi:hypothetical protein